MEPIISDEDLRSRLRFRDMVRERTLSLYEQLLGLDFRERVLSTLEKNGKFVWLSRILCKLKITELENH